MKRFLLAATMLLFAVPAFADYDSRSMLCTHKTNPDARTSLTLIAGVGQSEQTNIPLFAAPELVLHAALVHPASNNVSLLLNVDHAAASWNDTVYGNYTDRKYNLNVFSVGLRFFFP